MPHYSLFLTTGGLFAWGGTGKLFGLQKHFISMPTRLPFDCEILDIAAGIEYIILNTSDGLYGCGENYDSQLGFNEPHVYTWTKINLNYQVVEISCGNTHTVINTTVGLFGCGSNHRYQLDHLPNNRVDNFEKIEFNHNVLKVCCSYDCTIIHSSDGLFGCGDNSLVQLGLGNNSGRNKMRLMPFDDEVVDISCGDSFTVVQTDNGLYITGLTIFDEGDSHDHYYSVFFLIPFRHKVLSFFCGGAHIIINSSAGLFGSGTNTDGQLGLGHNENVDSLKMEQIPFTCEAVDIYGGTFHSIIQTTKGLFVSGYNSAGELGLGHYEPVNIFTQMPSSIKIITTGKQRFKKTKACFSR